MPDWWGWTAFAILVIAIVLLTPVVWLFTRRRCLAARSRVFDCALRGADAVPGSGWMLGVARYAGDQLQWYKVFSLSLRPWLVIDRSRSQPEATRRPDGYEATMLDADARVVTLTGADAGVALALPPHEMTAFLGWMEGGLPGRSLGGRSPSP